MEHSASRSARIYGAITLGATPGIPALIYKDQKMSNEFEADAIHTDSTTLMNLPPTCLARSSTSRPLFDRKPRASSILTFGVLMG
jgi:predicted metal-binding protein